MRSPWAKQELRKLKQTNWAGVVLYFVVVTPLIHSLLSKDFGALGIYLAIEFVLFIFWMMCIWKLIGKYDRAELGWKLDDHGNDIDSNPVRRKRIQTLAPFYLLYFTIRDRNKDWII